MNTATKTFLAASASVVLLLGLAGCAGGDDTNTPDPSPTNTTPPPATTGPPALPVEDAIEVEISQAETPDDFDPTTAPGGGGNGWALTPGVDPNMVTLYLYGSSSCIPAPAYVTPHAETANEYDVTLIEFEGEACTMDYTGPYIWTITGFEEAPTAIYLTATSESEPLLLSNTGSTGEGTPDSTPEVVTP